MPKMHVTVRELRYNGETLRYGDEFEASEKDAKALKLIGKASDEQKRPPLRVADPQPRRATETKQQPMQQTSFVAEGEPAPTEGRSRRRYHRTDMRSED